MDRRVYAAFALLVGTFFSITWFIIPQPPDVAMVGVRYRGARHVIGYPFSKGPGVPMGVTVEVFEATLHDGTREMRAYVTYDDRPPQYLGPLKHQLGDAPVQTIFVRAGNERVVMGTFDDTIRPNRPYITFVSSQINPRNNQLASLPGQEVKRSFSISIHEDEAERWPSLTKVYISSQTSMDKAWERAKANGVRYTDIDEDLDSDWVERFDPPLDIESLFIPVGDEFAGYAPTQQ